MKKTQLDDKIILYKENEIFDFFDILKKINEIFGGGRLFSIVLQKE